MNKQYLWMPVAMLMALPAVAQDEPAGPWSGKVALGYLATTGNTETSSFNTAAEVGYATGNWTHGLNGRFINASQDSVTTAESYQAGWNTRYVFSERSFAFGRLDYLNDKFAGFETQFSQTVGYGHKVINTKAHQLNLEIGVGAKQLTEADSIDSDGNFVAGRDQNDTIVRGGLDYTWAFSETAKFTQGLIIEAGDSNTFTESVTALNATLVGQLALVASFTVRNNSDVPAGSEKTDTFSALSLEYGF